MCIRDRAETERDPAAMMRSPMARSYMEQQAQMPPGSIEQGARFERYPGLNAMRGNPKLTLGQMSEQNRGHENDPAFQALMQELYQMQRARNPEFGDDETQPGWFDRGNPVYARNRKLSQALQQGR